MGLAPIVLFVYNRPWHTQQTVEALQKNDLAKESILYIFADGPKETATEEQKEKTRQVREYIHQIDGFKKIEIKEAEKNIGCADSIIRGISSVLKEYDKIIVVEDDIVTSKYFLKFINEALDFFEKDEHIFSVSGYNYSSLVMPIPQSYKKDIYLSLRHGSTGWGTWIDRWKKVDWEVSDFSEFLKNNKLQNAFNRGGVDRSGMLEDQMNGKIDAWDIIFDYSIFKNNSFTVRPIKSLTKHIGSDNSGTHSSPADEKILAVNLDDNWLPKLESIKPNRKLLKNFKKIFDPPPKPPRYSLKRFIGKVFKRIFK